MARVGQPAGDVHQARRPRARARPARCRCGPPASASSGWRSSRTPRPSRTRGTTSPTRPKVPATTACTTAPDRAAQAPPLDGGHHGGQADQREPDAVAAVRRVEVTGAGADPAGQPADQVREAEPDRARRPGRARAGPRSRAGPAPGGGPAGSGPAPAGLRAAGRRPAELRPDERDPPEDRPASDASRATSRCRDEPRVGVRVAMPRGYPPVTPAPPVTRGNTPPRVAAGAAGGAGRSAQPGRPGRASSPQPSRGRGSPRAGGPTRWPARTVGSTWCHLGLQGDQLDLVLDRLQPLARSRRSASRAGSASWLRSSSACSRSWRFFR